MTDFPPPPGFDGWEKCKWGGFRYERECTDEEAQVLEASAAAAEAEEREDEEKLREFWFTTLQRGLDDGEDQPACEASPPPLR